MKSSDLYILRRDQKDLSPALFPTNDVGSSHENGVVVVASLPRGLHMQVGTSECHDALSYSKLLEIVLMAKHVFVL